KGTGKFEWRGFLKADAHPHGQDNKQGYMTNWNNGVAHGFGAADNEFGRNGSVGRIDLLNFNLQRLKRKGKWSPAAITSAMNASASQDVRAIDMVPLLARLLQGSTAPSPLAQQMLNLMVQWRNLGGNRLDRDNDGKIDQPGVAIMDAAYPNIVNAEMGARIGPLTTDLNTLFARFDAPFNQPPGSTGQYDGWYMYFDRDIRTLLAKKGHKPADRYPLVFCGGGNKALCQQSIWAGIQAAGDQLTQQQGTSDPAAWRASESAEAFKFSPLSLITMNYTNRPSGIQQVISFRK